MAKRVVAMIPARSGSKGLPGKNVKNLCGRPLIDYSIKPALECRLVDNVYVNSEDPGYLDLASRLGARVYQRPAELATDTAPMKLVLLDFYDALRAQGDTYEAILVLYPVYPIRTAKDLEQIITAFFRAGGDRPLLGLKPTKTHPYLCYTQDEDGSIHSLLQVDLNKYYRRQDYPPCYEITFYACAIPASGLETLNSQLQNDYTVGYHVDPARAIDIDTADDFAMAERMILSSLQER